VRRVHGFATEEQLIAAICATFAQRLYEVLLYAEGDDAINYAQAAHAAARLINKSVEDLDSVRIRPLIDEIVFKSGVRVEDSAVSYWR
jgi:hypothetical protein